MKISERGQITIPKNIRNRFGFNKKVEIQFIPTAKGLLVQKRSHKEHPPKQQESFDLYIMGFAIRAKIVDPNCPLSWSMIRVNICFNFHLGARWAKEPLGYPHTVRSDD